MPSSIGSTSTWRSGSTVTRKRYLPPGYASARFGVRRPACLLSRRGRGRRSDERAGAVRPDAARARRGRASARGRAVAERRAVRRARCSPRATDATSWTATATGRWPRSSPTWTPAGTTSTSRSRTGSTTSTSARSSAPPTRSSPARCTSSATGAGTGGARWSPTATSTSSTTRTSPSLAAHLRDQPGGPVALWGIDNLPGSLHLETTEVPRRVCFLFGQEGPGLSDAGPRGLRRDVLDRAVRLDAVHQRLGRRRDRDARVGARARGPVRRLDAWRG